MSGWADYKLDDIDNLVFSSDIITPMRGLIAANNERVAAARRFKSDYPDRNLYTISHSYTLYYNGFAYPHEFYAEVEDDILSFGSIKNTKVEKTFGYKHFCFQPSYSDDGTLQLDGDDALDNTQAKYGEKCFNYRLYFRDFNSMHLPWLYYFKQMFLCRKYILYYPKSHLNPTLRDCTLFDLTPYLTFV